MNKSQKAAPQTTQAQHPSFSVFAASFAEGNVTMRLLFDVVEHSATSEIELLTCVSVFKSLVFNKWSSSVFIFGPIQANTLLRPMYKITLVKSDVNRLISSMALLIHVTKIATFVYITVFMHGRWSTKSTPNIWKVNKKNGFLKTFILVRN